MDSFWSLEAILEATFLGIDALILGLTYRSYRQFKETSQALENAKVIEPRVELMQSDKDWSKPYAVVRGLVTAMGNTLQSEMDPNQRGVIKRTILKEHKVTRKSQGFWTDEEGIINTSDASVPFMLYGKGAGVEIVEPQQADLLELMPTGDKYEQTSTDLWGHMKGILTGEHVKGVQKFEQMLLEGSHLTAAGELRFSSEGLQLHPPQRLLYLLSPLPLSRIQDKLNRQVFQQKVILMSFGAVGVLVVILLYRRYKKLKAAELKKVEDSRRLQKAVLERRRLTRGNDAPVSPTEACVVCLSNPKEVVLLDCGHVCVCVDCYLTLPENNCPMCRAEIVDVRAAYIS